MRQLLFFNLLLGTLLLHAQEDYLVKASGDTIYGKINFKKPEGNKEEVIIKTASGRENISANKLVTCVAEGKTYKSVWYNNKYYIMEVISTGYLSFYRFRAEGSFDFGTKYLHKKTQEGIEVPTISFRPIMSKFFDDCPDLSTAIDNKVYRSKDLDEIIQFYNERCLLAFQEGQAAEDTEFNSQDLDELQSVLNDVLTKKSEGDKIPKYLIKALEELATKDINNQLSELLKELKKED